MLGSRDQFTYTSGDGLRKQREDEAAVENLASAGRWGEAISKADSLDRDFGAPDQLLHRGITAVFDKTAGNQLRDANSLREASNTLQWCLRIRDKQLFCRIALHNLRKPISISLEMHRLQLVNLTDNF